MKTYSCDEHYFDVIDSEEKAYWLGFLLADGNVCEKKDKRSNSSSWRLAITLKAEDEEHLEKLKAALEANHPLHNWQGGLYKELAICSKDLCAGLIKHGCIPRKTCSHETPAIRKDLYRHMYRGYVDGDGCISRRERDNNWSFDVVGCPGFIEVFQRWLIESLGLSQTKLKPVGKALYVSYGGSQQVNRICNLLYDDARVCLTRKLEKRQQLAEQLT